MVLTRIEQTRQGNIALFVDDVFLFSLHPDVFARSRLAVGQAVQPEELEELYRRSQWQSAKSLALRLLSARSYTAHALCQKLLEKGFEEEFSQAAVARMQELGLIDDRDYALRYVRDCMSLGKLAPKAVRYKLQGLGIDSAYIDEALAQFDELDIDARILAVLQKKYPAAAREEKVRRRAVAGLSRMGYRYDEIRRALQALEQVQAE